MSSTDKEPEATQPGESESAPDSAQEASAGAAPETTGEPPAAEPVAQQADTQESAAPVQVVAAAPPSRGGTFIAWLALLLVLACAAAGYWFYMQAQLREEQLLNRIGLLQAEVEAQDKIVQEFDTKRIDDARNKALDRLSQDFEKELQRELREIFKNKTSAEWIRLGDEKNFPIAPVNSPKTIKDDPQFQDRFPLYGHERHGADMLPFPVKFAGEELPEPDHAPTVGQHNEEVLRSVLGYDDAAVEELRKAGALG